MLPPACECLRQLHTPPSAPRAPGRVQLHVSSLRPSPDSCCWILFDRSLGYVPSTSGTASRNWSTVVTTPPLLPVEVGGVWLFLGQQVIEIG